MAAVAGASPVTMTVRKPSAFNSEMSEAESVRGGSLSAMKPIICMDAGAPGSRRQNPEALFLEFISNCSGSGAGTARPVTSVKAPLTMRSGLSCLADNDG
jgi:hypothetical protein